MRIIYLCMAILAAACTPKENGSGGDALAAPTGLDVTQPTPGEVILSWADNCSGETGYYVFLAPADAWFTNPSATLPANATNHSFTGLTQGAGYIFGVQAYGENSTTSTMVYTQPVIIDKEPEPVIPEEPDPNPIEAITFNWTEVSGLDLPAAVKIYKTTDGLNGRAFNAWYAIGDPKQIEVRVLYPGNGVTKTIDQQADAAGNCLVLVNGGIFSSKYLLPIGFAIYDGEQTPWRVVEDDGQRIDREYWSADGRLHPVSRALFGVDRIGDPGVYWSFTPSHGTVYCYDQPIPSVAGEKVHEAGSTTYPCTPVDWTPYNALTCGPVLLHNGRCPINDKKTGQGYWETNYELWADDIFGVNQLADRTAVGFTAEGKVILCICDGRIDASKGANTLEMAAIMKGLGCVGAINLDGGGSTGMWARGGGHLNDLTGGNRAVMTTVGFFEGR